MDKKYSTPIIVTTLQIPNSLGDKFAQWDSKNEALITHYE